MYKRPLVFAAACLGTLVFGIVMTTLGPILPALIDRFGLDKAHAGSLFLLMSLGILAGSLVFGPIVDRYGYKRLLALCTFLVFVGLQGLAWAPAFGWLRGAVFLIGFGGGVLNGGTNALVSDISTAGRSAGLSLLGVFFGVGAFGVPFLLGFLLDAFTYATLVAAVGGLVVVPLLFFLFVPFPAPKQAQGFPIRAGFGLLRERVLILMGLLLFLQSGIEITVGGWTATYFNERLALDEGRAAFVLSLFWLGMTSARFGLGFLLRQRAAAPVLLASFGVAFAGAVLLLASERLLLAVPGIFLVGAGLAAGFPVVLGYAGDRYTELSGTAFSILFAMALTGGSLLPYLTGLLGEAFGLRTSFLIVPLGLVGMALLFGRVLRRLREAPAAHRPAAG